MSVAVTTAQVIMILEELGLETWQAEIAAHDPLLPPWDMEGLKRCVEFIQHSTANRPPATLWTQLSKRHTLPSARRPPAAPKGSLRLVTEDDTGPYYCPWCKQDWSICLGIHGWPAAARDRIAPPPALRPRRTRKGKNTA